MYVTEDLEIWNLTPGIPAMTGAQRIFNIVGHLKRPETVALLTYRLNGGPEKPVFFNDTQERSGRLELPGDFNIDTVRLEELRPRNHLLLRLYPDKQEVAIDFPTCSTHELQPVFLLKPGEIQAPEQAGQVVDGKWRLGRDERGEPCLEIRKEDAGYDRIILFGRHNWTCYYEVSARLSVSQWIHKVHNVGLLFKWNPHHPGDGRHLPTRWSTGLGYYFSRSLGLRLRFGVDVHYDEQGNKLGDTLLGEAPLSMWAWRKSQLLKRFLPQRPTLPTLIPGIPYCFHLRIHPDQYALTVWQAGKKPPRPQVIALHPIDRLPHGCVGLIAYQCALRVYEYQVQPLPVPAGERSSASAGWID
jgi:hypothetical protein